MPLYTIQLTWQKKFKIKKKTFLNIYIPVNASRHKGFSFSMSSDRDLGEHNLVL